jgi:hypothetical protein
LTDDQNSYEKYRTSQKKLTIELDNSLSMIKSLSEEILPRKTSEFQDAKRNLKIVLNAYLLRCRPTADAKINELLRECIAVRQDFLDAFARIFDDYGLNFIVSDENSCPGIWGGLEIRDLKLRLGIESAPEAESAPEVPQNEPVLTQAPAEGSLLPSEGTLQAPEPQTPLVEVSGAETETSGTLLTGEMPVLISENSLEQPNQ